jgi:mono/diheme cytochrome c family protein
MRGRLLRTILVAIVVIIAAAAGALYYLSDRELRRTYAVPSDTVPVPGDPASILRGAHLFKTTTCSLCHAEDGGGSIYADLGLVGLIAGPNLTRGRGGVGDARTDQDFVRAIRYGVRPDGTSLIVMPSEVFTHLTDADLGSVIAYIRQLPPVDRELPATRFGPMGRVLLATGRMNILVAPKTKHEPNAPAPSGDAAIAIGRYLADISGCHGCHGYGLSGGRVAGPADLPPASNLTPAGLSTWTAADFIRVMREGRRPDGSAINEFMPWRAFAAMTDTELHALWMYLRSVPPKPFGNK